VIATDPIPTQLAEIASLLRREDYYLSSREICEKQALDIDALRDAALSAESKQQAHFRVEITQNGWYWLGMGTIADIVFTNVERNSQFIRAYFALAIACESAGLGSIYSRNVKDIFGKWIRDGLA
jgi:hypothetical protein